MISGAGAGNIEKLPFGVVDLFQIRVVCYSLNPLLQRNNFIVASHHSHGTKFKPLGEVHGSYRSLTVYGLNPVVENLKWNRSQFGCRSGAI